MHAVREDDRLPPSGATGVLDNTSDDERAELAAGSGISLRMWSGGEAVGRQQVSDHFQYHWSHYSKAERRQVCGALVDGLETAAHAYAALGDEVRAKELREHAANLREEMGQWR